MKKSIIVRNCHVLITGAASGIGRALTELLLNKYDCTLVLLDKDKTGLAALKKNLNQKYKDRFETHVIDLADSAAITLFLQKHAPKDLDILINNAGIFYAGAFANMDMDDFETVVSVNLLAPVKLTHALLPQLSKSPTPVIVNVSSLAGLIGGPGMVAYSTSKFGMVGFAEALVGELPSKFHFCTVCPSFVRTDILNNCSSSSSIPDPEKTGWMDKMGGFLQKNGKEPEKVACTIIKAIETRKRFVLINPDAHFLHLSKRILPVLTGRVVGAAYKHLKRRGVVSDEF